MTWNLMEIVLICFSDLNLFSKVMVDRSQGESWKLDANYETVTCCVTGEKLEDVD